jgi:hypothetical protein
VEGFLASPEKALFDLAYLSTMNRSQVSGSLPETDLKGMRWSEVQSWLRRIPSTRIRAAVEQAVRSLRDQHTEREAE